MIPRLIACVLLAGFCHAQTPETKPVAVSPDILARYAGIYRMAPNVTMMGTPAQRSLDILSK